MIEAHLIFEALGYFIAARLYWRYAARQPQPPLMDRWVLIAAAVLGAFLGAKGLHLLQHWPHYSPMPPMERLLNSGKTVLGAFLGGTLLVELAKRAIGWPARTGDAWVVPLLTGLMIGRIGCQLSGLWDQTYGSPTQLPWAWDYGDGIGRHPVALYEILLLSLLALHLARRTYPVNGMRFTVFMGGYCLIRFGLEFLKPPYGDNSSLLPIAHYGPLTAIQWAALAGGLYFGWQYHSLKRSQPAKAPETSPKAAPTPGIAPETIPGPTAHESTPHA